MLKVHNSASRELEEFAPREPGRVRMYVCGLTVYNDMHLGHARSYVSFDAIRRWLEHSDYTVEHVQNHTDIDDKIIARATEEGALSWRPLLNSRTQSCSSKKRISR